MKVLATAPSEARSRAGISVEPNMAFLFVTHSLLWGSAESAPCGRNCTTCHARLWSFQLANYNDDLNQVSTLLRHSPRYMALMWGNEKAISY